MTEGVGIPALTLSGLVRQVNRIVMVGNEGFDGAGDPG
jgi:hypothetical protein